MDNELKEYIDKTRDYFDISITANVFLIMGIVVLSAALVCNNLGVESKEVVSIMWLAIGFIVVYILFSIISIVRLRKLKRYKIIKDSKAILQNSKV